MLTAFSSGVATSFFLVLYIEAGDRGVGHPDQNLCLVKGNFTPSVFPTMIYHKKRHSKVPRCWSHILLSGNSKQ